MNLSNYPPGANPDDYESSDIGLPEYGTTCECGDEKESTEPYCDPCTVKKFYAKWFGGKK